MATGSDYIGIGMMAAGGAVAAAGFFGKTAMILPQTGMSDAGLLVAGTAAFTLGAAVVATSGSKSMF